MDHNWSNDGIWRLLQEGRRREWEGTYVMGWRLGLGQIEGLQLARPRRPARPRGNP